MVRPSSSEICSWRRSAWAEVGDAAPLSGVHAALITPFDERRALDPKALNHLVDYALGLKKLGGLALLTEAAEDAVLTNEEREKLVRLICKRTKGKLPCTVFVSSPRSIEAADLAKLAESEGAQAIVVSTPRLPGLGYRELYRHFDRITRAVEVPVLINVRPGGVLDSLQPEELDTFLAHRRLGGVVTAHAPADELQTWVQRFDGRVASVLSGCSLANGNAVAAGAHGVVCGLVLIAAEQSAALQTAIAAGAPKPISKLESRLAPAVEVMGPPVSRTRGDGMARLATKIAKRSLEGSALRLTYPFPQIKAVLKLEGHPVRPDVRPPFETLRPEAVERLRATLRRAGVLS